MSSTAYFKQLVLQYTLNKVAYSVTPHVGLFLDDPGIPTSEVVGGGYARLPVTFDSSYNSTNELKWIASGAWGTIIRVALCGGLTGNNAMIYGTVNVTITANTGIIIPAGNLTINIT